MIIDKSILKNCENLSDWGDIHLCEITSGDDFWSLFYELSDYEVMCDETSNNTNTNVFNKTLFIESYKYGYLYSLYVDETKSMKKRKAYKDNIFCKYTYYLLPCFCIKKKHTIINIWVHPRIKRHNFGSVIVENIMKINNFENKKNDKEDIDNDNDVYDDDDNEDDINNDIDNNPTSIHKGLNNKLKHSFSSFFR
jgi:hypothetical protein